MQAYLEKILSLEAKTLSSNIQLPLALFKPFFQPILAVIIGLLGGHTTL